MSEPGAIATGFCRALAAKGKGPRKRLFSNVRLLERIKWFRQQRKAVVWQLWQFAPNHTVVTLNTALFAVLLISLLVPLTLAQEEPMPLAPWWPDSFSFEELNMPKEIKGLKIGQMSPNEIKRLALANWPKTAGLKLGITKRSDIILLFGNDCNVPCRLDDKVTLSLNYYDRLNGRGSDSFVVSDGLRKKTRLRDKFYDTLESITLSPWTYLAVTRTEFPTGLERICQARPGKLISFEEGLVKGQLHMKEIGRETRYEVQYFDGYGFSFTTTLRGEENCSKPPPLREFIDIISYRIPYGVERTKMYEIIPGEIIP